MFRTEIKIAGITHKNEDGQHRQDLLGTLYDDFWTEDEEEEIQLELRREPENEYDPNAVGVWCIAPKDAEGRLGFVPADQAEFVGEAIKANRLKRSVMSRMEVARGGGVWGRVKLTILDGHDSPDDEDIEAELRRV